MKFGKHTVYCMECDWELKGTHKNTDGWKCPKCSGPVNYIYNKNKKDK